MSKFREGMIFLCVFLAISSAMFDTADAVCNPNNVAPNVCLYDQGDEIDSDNVNECHEANINPFAVTAPGGNSLGCQSLAFSDGDDCIESYANFICSWRCARCSGTQAVDVCNSVCSDAEDRCPTAWDAGCFLQSFRCSDDDDNCSEIAADRDRLPSPSPSPVPAPSPGPAPVPAPSPSASSGSELKVGGLIALIVVATMLVL